MKQELERLEGMLEEIAALVDDPDISDDELRDQIRAVLEEDTDDDE